MRPFLALLILAGCGPTPYLEPAQSRAGVTSQQPTTSAPVDCHAVCIKVRPQLIRDFGVPPGDIDCEQRQWLEANDCAACSQVLAMNYGVLPTSCP